MMYGFRRLKKGPKGKEFVTIMIEYNNKLVKYLNSLFILQVRWKHLIGIEVTV